MERLSFQSYHQGLTEALNESDADIYELIKAEYERLQNTIQLLAAESRCSRAVLAALGSVLQNKTSEGFAGARLHGGSVIVDEIERIAVDRAKEAFGARYANVQPHSGTTANQIAINALLEPGERILSMGLQHGGHYSHGSADSLAGRFFDVEQYYVDPKSFVLDYESIRDKALKVRPKLIICGGSAYTRTISFAKFREIADEVGSFLLADISHISALVIAGLHPSPLDYAHVTTTSTYKPGGPRGGLILMGRDCEQEVTVHGKSGPMWRHIERTTFPCIQGTPYLNHIAAKAVFFKEVLCERYRARQLGVVENARRLAENLVEIGYDVLTGGTDNHMVLVNVANSREGLTGLVAQRCLERCGIVVDKCPLAFDEKEPAIAGGLRLGTPIVTRNGMGIEEMGRISGLVDEILRTVEIVSESEYRIKGSFEGHVKAQVKELCNRFPLH